MSIKRMQEESKNNNSNSTLNLARCYLEGIGVEKDNQKAVSLLEKAIKQGNVEAQTYLAYCYLNGIGTSKNEAKAASLYKEAADASEPCACYCFGMILKKGLYGVEKNLKKARELFEKAASQNIYEAKYEVGVSKNIEANKLLESGEAASIEKAKSLMKEVEELYKAAADKGNFQAKFALGLVYAQSSEAEKNKKAFALFKECADDSNPAVDYAIACMYDLGIGVQRDYWLSFEWFKKAYDAGYKKALFNLIYAYMTGLGVKKNYTKAINLCRDAVNQGVVEANYFAGVCFKYGFDVDQNNDKAMELFGYAAEVEYAPALYQLGLLNDSYYGYSSNDKKAKEYYSKAYSLGSMDAGAELARLMLDQDKKKAIEMLQNVASKHSVVGNEVLAELYEEGKYIAQDLSKALNYYKAAADLGSLSAAKKVVKIARQNNNDALLKTYKDKVIIKKDLESYMQAAQDCEQAKDYERAAFWYAMSLQTKEDDEIVEKADSALNKFVKDASGKWTVK